MSTSGRDYVTEYEGSREPPELQTLHKLPLAEPETARTQEDKCPSDEQTSNTPSASRSYSATPAEQRWHDGYRSGGHSAQDLLQDLEKEAG